MGSRQVQRIQDSVHGLMEFRGLETLVVEVLRTPELQRLRKVRQLGLVHYVFPGAEHSRLSHSLGAAYLAIRFGHQVKDDASRVFVRHLVPDEHAITDLALAALCHDLGHGPLSHAWEREIVGDNFDRAAWLQALGLDKDGPSLQEAKWHELVGQGLLAWQDGQLHRLLELHERGTSTRIRQLLGGDYYIPYLPRLLGSDVDVDRADFIRRDTLNTGVAYGRYDLDWLISTCTLGRTAQSEQWVVGFDGRKALRVVEQFLIARQAMYDTVYHHKTVRCIEGMVATLLKRLKELVALGARPSVVEILEPTMRILSGEVLAPPDLLKLDDFSVFVLIDTVAQGAFRDDTAQDLARRLQARELFKLVPVSSDDVTNFFASRGNAERLYDAVKRFVPGDAEYYVLVDRTRFSMMSRVPERQAMLVDGNRNASPCDDHEALAAYRQRESTRLRLFTVGPAVDVVTSLVAGSAPR
jgi:HD superfamily phosphohydrolase